MHVLKQLLSVCVLAAALPVAAQNTAAPGAGPEKPVLTLDIALRMALSNDHVIAMARGDERIGRLEYEQAKRAFGPTVSLEGDYRRSESPTDDFISRFNPAETWDGWFRISQPLLDARVAPARRRDFALWQAGAYDYTNTVRTRLLGVATLFYRAIQAQTIATVAEQARQLAELEVQRAAVRVQAGESRQTDLLRAQVDQSRAERTLNDARNDVVLSARDLFRAVGLSADATVSVQKPAALPEPPLAELAPLLEFTRTNRNDLQSARLRIGAARENAEVARKDKAPKVDLAFNEHVADPEIFSKGRDTWDVAVVARLDVWDKGRRRTKLRQDLERLEQARHALGETWKRAAGETERAMAALGTARLNFATAQREEELASQNYAILSEQAKGGLATALDVSTALVDLTRASMDKVRLEYEVEIAKIALRAATGQMPVPMETTP